MNSINVVGRMTADPELKATQSGISVCSFTLAVKRPRVKDTTDFLPVVAWRQSAEYICKYAHKGSTVAVSGILTARKYVVDDHNRTAYEIIAESVLILGEKDTSHALQNQFREPNEIIADNVEFEQIAGDQDLPF